MPQSMTLCVGSSRLPISSRAESSLGERDERLASPGFAMRDGDDDREESAHEVAQREERRENGDGSNASHGLEDVGGREVARFADDSRHGSFVQRATGSCCRPGPSGRPRRRPARRRAGRISSVREPSLIIPNFSPRLDGLPGLQGADDSAGDAGPKSAARRTAAGADRRLRSRST